MNMALRKELSQNAASPHAPWLLVLENELRRRVGWADELVSPFARSHRQVSTKAALHIVHTGTLLSSPPPGRVCRRDRDKANNLAEKDQRVFEYGYHLIRRASR